jgi:hypothetical protein
MWRQDGDFYRLSCSLGPLVSPQKVGYSRKRVKMAIWVSPKSQAVFKDFSKYGGGVAVSCGLDERMPSLWIALLYRPLFQVEKLAIRKEELI